MPDKKYLFANWKMYLNHQKSVALAKELVSQPEDFSRVTIAVFPGALAFAEVAGVLQSSAIRIGAQNAHWVEEGGYTGEVSAAMYKEAGAQYLLIGHSERRHLFGETNHEVRQKVEAALALGLTPVICVGETETERQQNQTADIIETQVRSAFHNIDWPQGRELVVAYEPVWAIGTGLACDAVEAEKVHELIKKQIVSLINVKPIMLYGGSVKADNVSGYINNPTIDGVLVGAASIHADKLRAIAGAIAQ